MKVLHNAVTMPIFQPLISYDKQEIVDLAKKIGTYQISIDSYKDCCSLISKTPRTRSKEKLVETFEKQIKMEELIDEAIKNLSVYENLN